MLEATCGFKNVPKCRTLLTRPKNSVFLKIYIKTRNSVPKLNVNKLNNNGPNNGVLLQCFNTETTPPPPTYFSPQWVAYLSNIFDIGSAHIQSDDCCLKGYFKKTWAELFKAGFNKITQG